jgi:acetyl-CoA C-acetyltransferase
MPKARYGYKMGHGEIYDHMIKDGLWCALSDCHMGITAENVAHDYEISRADQDEFSAQSQQKTAQAWERGAFADEVVPVEVKSRKGPVMVDKDEHFRADTTA